LRARPPLRYCATARPTRALLAAAGTLFAIVASEAAARAATVDVPPDCGSAREFQGEVEARLGSETALPALELEIRPDGQRYRMRLRLRGETRDLEDADCRALFRAAVVIAVAVTLSETREPHPTPAPVAPPAPARPTSKPAASNQRFPFATDANANHWVFALALGGGVNLGLLPKAAPALELYGELAYRRFGLGLSLRYLAPSARQDESARGVSVQAVGGEMALLYRAGLIDASAGVAAYDLFGSGFGVGAREDAAWAVGPAVGLSIVALQTRWLWLSLGGELYWNVQAPKFQILNYGQIFSSSPLSGILFLRVGPRFL
jgi:hypothetical protein